jgi:hypothetical protein
MALVILLSGLAALAGCAPAGVAFPPQVDVAEIEPSGRAAKPPDCDMPVLRTDPLGDFRKVATVEAIGNVYATEKDVMPALKRGACGTGADAVLILASKSQTGETLTGYYINAIAIVYGKRRPSEIEGGKATERYRIP